MKPTIRLSRPDYTYGYGDALKDEEVVRHIVFPGWDGEFSWSDWFGEQRKASFQSPLNKTDAGHRLKTALNASGDAMRTMLSRASQKLDDVRRDGHTDAGGLIVAQDQATAKLLAALIEQTAGEKPIIALSENGDEASLEIERFRRGNQKWIIAVKMVSEGVDIKRLRVGVYATNTKTETFFRQVIGRVIRWDSQWSHLDDQTAWFYVPEDPELVNLMKGVKDEIVHSVEDKQTEDKKKQGEQALPPFAQIPMGDYEFLSSEGDERNHHADGQTVSMDELAYAESVFATTPGFERIPSARKALFLRNNAGKVNHPEIVSPPQATTVQPAYERKQVLATAIKSRVGRLVIVCRQMNIQIQGNPYKTVNTAWGRAKGYTRDANNNELEDKLNWLDKLIQRAIDGDKTIQAELRP